MGMSVTSTSKNQARCASELPTAAPWSSQEPCLSGYTVFSMSGISLTYLFYDFRWRQGLGTGASQAFGSFISGFGQCFTTDKDGGF